MTLTGLMLVFAIGTAQSVVPPGTVSAGADLQANLKKAIADAPDAPMVVARVESTATTRVNLIHRTVPQNAIIHATGWEVHHITDGTGTVVTGGRVVRSTRADGERVAKIEDGSSRVVTAGDVVIIPAGTPHWYSDIDGSVTYLEIRYDPGSN